MKKPCTGSTFVGALEAHRTVSDGPLFDEFRLDELFDGMIGAPESYSRVMNIIMDRQAAKIDVSKEMGGGNGWRGVQSFRTWEALIPAKQFKKIDTRMSQWDAVYQKEFGQKQRALQRQYDRQKTTIEKNFNGDDKKQRLKALERMIERESDKIKAEAKKEYQEMVGKPLSQDLANITKLVEKYGVETEVLDAKLKQLGMTREDMYFTNEYMKWLQGGGPYFPQSKSAGVADGLLGLMGNLVKNKVRFNPKISAYNFTEVMQKAPTLGAKNTLNGTLTAFKAASDAGTTIFGRLPELENKGIYGNDFNPMRVEGKYDPVALSQNMLDNIGYYVGKEAGDYQKGLKEIAYRPKPWNDAAVFSSDGAAKSLLGWMTFQTRHMQQYGGWLKTAFAPGKTTPEQRVEALKALGAYSLMTGMLFGSNAAVPAPLWMLYDKYIKANTGESGKEAWSNFSEEHFGDLGVLADRGLVNITTGGKMDISDYTRPLGGVAFGITMDMANGLMDIGPEVGKVLKNLADDKPEVAASVIVTTLAQLSQLHTKGLADPIVRASEAATKFIIEGHDFEDIADHYPDFLLKRLFGEKSVQETEDSELEMDLAL